MDENQVIAAVCAHYERLGFSIKQRLHTTEHGVDVVTWDPATRHTIYVEAKGGTSSRNGSARFGRPYTQSQVFDRVSKGVYTTLALRSVYHHRAVADVALAVPDSRWFRYYLNPISAQLQQAGLQVLLVGESGEVTQLS